MNAAMVCYRMTFSAATDHGILWHYVVYVFRYWRNGCKKVLIEPNMRQCTPTEQALPSTIPHSQVDSVPSLCVISQYAFIVKL